MRRLIVAADENLPARLGRGLGLARARNEQRAFFLSNWVVFVGFTATGLLLALVVAWMMPGAFLSGAVVGAALVLIPGGLWVLTIQATGTASSMMGDDAEQWTAAELRGLSRGGWRLVNHVALSPNPPTS